MDVQAYLDDFYNMASAMGFQREVIEVVDGYEIPAYTREVEGGESVYLSSGCHGDEPAGPWALLELMKEGFFSDRYTWQICPVLNPVGLVAGTRENGDGVDLNRDYLKKQTAEVRGHVAWLEKQQIPNLFLSLHEDWESKGFYLYEIQKEVCKSWAKFILSEVSEVMITEPNRVIDGHEVREPGWIFHEPHADVRDLWPEAIFMAERGVPISYTFETPSSSELADRVRCHQLAVKCAVRELQLTHGG